MINSVLVANRGEIARRVFRSCADAGIRTVAVYSDADADLPHTREADAAVRLPGNTPSETYLRGEAIIAAARQAGADAIHPGYGFLSENAGFAQAVVDAGLTWIGPPPAAIAAMASKVAAKRIMTDAGVPVLSELDPAEIKESQLPVLVKASAGGGGRGMRVVHELSALDDAINAASAEAGSAFGDATVFCERYLPTGHHIEVQVLADEHGTIWAVGERECSIQRRHQKVIEEAPSPLVDDAMRQQLLDAARAGAKAIGYVGAGTVEFLAVPHGTATSGPDSGSFFFLEMNTRLQVEHPVTECVTDVDLVGLQLRIAESHRLPPEPPPQHGHAIEVRLYAEDPAHDWQPQSGTIHAIDVPRVSAEFRVPARGGIRLDAGFESGSVVGVHYDPMLAKVIALASTRGEAARMLAAALAGSKIHGLVTNRDLLVSVLRHPAFLAGETDTAFFDRHGIDTLSTPLADDHARGLSALAAALATAAANRAQSKVLSGLPSGWRNIASQRQRKSYRIREDTIDVDYRITRAGLDADGHDDVELVTSTAQRVVLTVAGVRRNFDVASYGDQVYVDSPLGPVALRRLPRYTAPDAAVPAGSLLAPMPGSVLRVAVEQGATVKSGQPLLWLEAMKMEHEISAPADGVVAELPVSRGQQVDVGTLLAVVRAAEDKG